MMTEKSRKLLSLFIVFVCWLPQATFLFPVPTIQIAEQINSFATESFSQHPEMIDKGIFNEKEYSTEQVYKNLWLNWLFKLSLIVMGVLSGAMLFYSRNIGKLLTILSSGIYLFVWYSTGSTASVSLIQSFKLKAQLAQTHNQYGLFAYLDVLLPFSFICLIFLMSYSIFYNNE